MGLREIVSIRQVTEVTDTGGLEEVVRVDFTTDATSGLRTVSIPAGEATPDRIREAAQRQAQNIDAALTEES